MRYRTIALLISCLFPAIAGADGIFKCTGPAGMIVQDHPCSAETSTDAASAPGANRDASTPDRAEKEAAQQRKIDAPNAIGQDAEHADTEADSLAAEDQRNYRMHSCMVDLRAARLKGTPGLPAIRVPV